MLKNFIVAVFMLVITMPASVSATTQLNQIDQVQDQCQFDDVQRVVDEPCEEQIEQECEIITDDGVCADPTQEEPVEEPKEEPKPEPAPQVLAETTPEQPTPVLAETGIESVVFVAVGLLIASTAFAVKKN